MYDDEMARKKKLEKEHQDRRFAMRFQTSEMEELKEEAAAKIPPVSVNLYIRTLLATHPDRPKNKKK